MWGLENQYVSENHNYEEDPIPSAEVYWAVDSNRFKCGEETMSDLEIVDVSKEVQELFEEGEKLT